MLLGGDEFGRTQQGNNNAYCQDNEISWFDWTLLDKNRELFQFVQGLIAFRKRNRVLSLEQFYRPDEIAWFNPGGHLPDWRQESVLGCHIHQGREGGPGLCLLFNPLTHSVDFHLPRLPDGAEWRKAIDTQAPAGEDIHPEGRERPLHGQHSLQVRERSVIVLIARKS
jgi:glycogen operon protein